MEIDIETFAEIVARAVLKVLDERERTKVVEKPEPLGWQPTAIAAKALNVKPYTLGKKRRDGIFRFNTDYKLAPQPKTAQSPRYLFHVENCRKKLGLNL